MHWKLCFTYRINWSCIFYISIPIEKNLVQEMFAQIYLVTLSFIEIDAMKEYLLRAINEYRQFSFYTNLFCTIFLQHDLKIYTTFYIYVIIFRLTRFSTDILWPHLSALAGAVSDITVTPSVMRLHFWYNHMACVVSSSTLLAFLTNMSEKHKSTSPTACNPSKK